jgi:hypothetical protein
MEGREALDILKHQPGRSAEDIVYHTKEQAMTEKRIYRATVKTEQGQEVIVFPRSKKSTLFPTIEAALKALELHSKRGLYGQGCVYRQPEHVLMTTIGL